MIQVVAANQEVEAANAKRQKESERSLQALQQRSSDDYSKQVCNGSLTKSPHAVVVYQTACVLCEHGYLSCSSQPSEHALQTATLNNQA